MSVPFLQVCDDLGSRVIYLEDEFYLVGRSPQCPIKIESNYTSRIHCSLFRNSDGGWSVRDGYQGRSSLNGILINGQAIDFADLKNKDVITVGTQATMTYLEGLREMLVLSGEDTFVGGVLIG